MNSNIKRFVIGFFILITHSSLSAQIIKKGILLKNIQAHKKGDTISIYGERLNSSTDAHQYFIKDYSYRFINAKKIQLVDDNYDYWENLWFKNRAVSIKQKGFLHSEELNDDAQEFYNQLLQNNLIFRDEFFYDYLYYLVNKIHPKELIKKKPTTFKLVIMKSNEKEYIVFDNGLIVLTTSLIANTKSERELVGLLTKCIAHVVLEHNSVNLEEKIKTQNRAKFWAGVAGVVSSAAMAYGTIKNDNYFSTDEILLVGASAYLLTKSVVENIGANYSSIQNTKSLKIVRDYLKKHETIISLNNDEYTSKISNLIRYSAWQLFHSLEYHKASAMIDRVKKNNLQIAEDVLLTVKISRLTDSSNESNHKILSIIDKMKNSEDKLVELHKEEALIYLRLNKKKEAKESLSNYRYALIEMQKNGFDTFLEIQEVNQMLRKL